MKISPHTQELFDRLKKMHLPNGKYAVFGSGPLGVRGLHDCHDLDVVVTEELYERFRKNRIWKEKITNGGSKYLENAGIELYEDWKPGSWDVLRLIDGAEIIDGLPFVSLQHVLSWKKLHHRAKDLEHIKKYEDTQE